MYRTPSPTSDDGVPPADDLPRPAIASTVRKTTRFQTGLKTILWTQVHWARFKSQLGTGSALSESAIEASAGESTEGSSNYRRYIEKVGGRNTPAVGPADDGPVDEIVVDNQFLVPGEKSVTQPSEVGDKQYTPDGHNSHQHTTEPRLNSHGIPASDSYFEGTANSIWDKHPALVALSLSFHDPEAESHYLKERYYTKKRLAFFASLFFILNWILALALIPRPLQTIDHVFYYGVAPAITVPGPLFIIFDVYRRAPWFYQLWLTAQTYIWAACALVIAKSLFTSFTTGLPVMALFGMHQHRLPAALAASIIAILMGVLVIPWRTSWSRNLINFIIYQVFLLYLHFMYETAERRLHKLRDQLKTQYKATQKAQVSERKAADSKRRLTSYIFHEICVIVVLNSAIILVLATQNMAAAMTLSKEHDVEFNALEGSLSMMSKVLNDVLDFNRMDSGKFESVSKPYAFHTVMRSMLVPLRLAADARGLELISEFDPAIDETIRKANQGDEIKRGLVNGGMVNQDDYEEDAVVLGDEPSLPKLVERFSSGPNFSLPHPPGLTPSLRRVNQVHLGSPVAPEVTLLLHPEGTHMCATRKKVYAAITVIATLEKRNLGIVIRILVLSNRLWCESRWRTRVSVYARKIWWITDYSAHSTRQKLVGLVRHIVRLSGGRLGVKSERDVGSMFWVELSLGVGRRVNNAIARNKSKDDALTNIARSRIIERSGFVLDASSGVGPEPHDITPSTIASNPSDIGFVPTLPIESNAALKTIIVSSHSSLTSTLQTLILSQQEHGGMVELASRRPRAPAGTGEVPIVVTRNMDSADASALANAALGQAGILASGATKDATTGVTSTTDASAPSTNVDSTSDLATTHATPIATTPKTVHQRPSYMPLPERQQFNFPPPELSANDDSKRPGPAPMPDKKGSTSGSALSGSTTVEKTNTLNVLIVDDDPLTRRLMSRMLTRLGCTCETAENGLIALEMLLGPMTGTPSTGDPPPSTNSELSGTNAQGMGKYAVVFLDNQCVGLEVMRQLRSIGRQDFVVGVTGNALKEDQEEYYEAGVDHVLTKPVLERSLKQMLVMADERRRTQPQQGTAMSS
ncbi:putative histidine kinase [Rhizoctonia solani AG-1 IA]|uniref:Putative histidine kinase n=1 Tax=Thanatephorus cucumeris (strain AG1-IA) TaxID=983506 RepID=L8WZJ2_THACA|nr:putative histidine kinase [Rhizoctonia solani AG-1 IA]